MSGLFWRIDRRPVAIQPFLPHMAGKLRVVDRPFASGTLQGFGAGLPRWTLLPNTGLTRPCSTASMAGANEIYAWNCFRRWRPISTRQQSR
jgi:hypothetical protein